MVVAVLVEGLSGEELNQICCDIEVDVGVLHVCSWAMGSIPYLRGVVCTIREKILLQPGAGVPGDGWWTGEVEPMIGEGVCGEAGGMGKDHTDGDGVIGIIRVPQRKWKIHIDVIIELKESLVVELHKRGAGDGLGDGGNDVDGLGGRWFVCFEV